MNIIHDFRSQDTAVCPKCSGSRACFGYRYERQLTNEPQGLTVTCRCGYQWYERAADYEEPVEANGQPG
jgi:DNA-directed RNA polymerase subunit M/transcription elongation factor TFIIS